MIVLGKPLSNDASANFFNTDSTLAQHSLSVLRSYTADLFLAVVEGKIYQKKVC